VVNDHVFQELEQIYTELERDISQALCRACGECCHFKSAGHILFVTDLEKMYFDSIHHGYRESDGPTEICPFLSGPLCTAREARPLACRTFFCAENKADRETRYELYLRKIRKLSQKYGIPCTYTPMFMTGNSTASNDDEPNEVSA